MNKSKSALLFEGLPCLQFANCARHSQNHPQRYRKVHNKDLNSKYTVVILYRRMQNGEGKCRGEVSLCEDSLQRGNQ